MSSNGQHAPDAAATNRRRLLIVAAIVLALLVFGGGYVLGQSDDETAAPTTTAPGPSETATPKPSRSASESESATASPSSSTIPTAEPADHLTDGKYFVRLTDIQGGEEGPLQLQYDLAYFLTGAEANQAAADRGLETPVPNDYLIVNDTHKLRLTPLAGTYGVKYIPEGNCCQPVKAHAAQFLQWMGQTNQTDFPPKETSWWWITIEGGEVTQIKQQYLP